MTDVLKSGSADERPLEQFFKEIERDNAGAGGAFTAREVAEIIRQDRDAAS
jgi:hypothetical protein